MKTKSFIQIRNIPEILWLSAVFLIPLICVSQYYFTSENAIAHAEIPKVALLRTLAACIALSLLFQLSASNIRSLWTESISGFIDLRKNSAACWILGAVTFFALSTIATTILSSNPKISMWGFIPGQDGYSTYNIISYLIIFSSIVINLHTMPQLKRLIIAIIVMGVVSSFIGFFQHFGVNIFGFLPSNDYSRASLTTGNAVLAGSVLVMTITVTLVSATIHLHKRTINSSVSIASSKRVVLWVFVLSIQISALLFTLSRGPWIATTFAIFLFLLLLIFFSGWRKAIAPTIVVITAIVAAYGVSYLPTSYSQEYSSPKIPERISSISSEVTSGGLNQRFNIWKASWILISERPWFESSELPLNSLRTVIGYGPETFRYVFNLTAPPSTYGGLPLEATHAHNHFIHQAVVQGILGFASSLALLSAPILAAGYQLITRFRTNSQTNIIILCGITSVASGRFAEQLVGLSKVSDLTVFWVLLGAALCAPSIINSQKLRTNVTYTELHVPFHAKPLKIFLLTLISLSIVLITWQKTLLYPISAHSAGESRYLYISGEYEQALITINSSIKMTPDVPYYYYFKFLVLAQYYEYPNIFNHPTCTPLDDISDNNKEYKTCIAEDAHSALLTAKLYNPYWYHATLALADSSKQLGLDQQSLSLYQELIRLLPTNRILLHLLAEEYLLRGMYDESIDTINKSLLITESHSQTRSDTRFLNEANAIKNRTIAKQTDTNTQNTY